ncbi:MULTISPECIES: ABC transporter permease [Paenibacillus]|uniref:ABC transporter permease n=2 Tax=Paenibacillus polymyxa TaxID=1406 RepID=E3EAG1_PAEPS|nr:MULTISPECIES: ABC transporter permease [Paenibacillus]ADO58579.1 ABC transporter permease [Paenibacillus polymyxa SC2]AJE52362.1 ABC transporter permease [Paenibacillus polymyxa]KAF6583900.1 FtsX-like permease family protein [Paenibacillus sp. EKM211P]KJD40141.1 ABC transporter permease [Paenibacillus polymyxa]MDU8673058.1 ABC transporter permease [Paenibacillus polymyxa]
MIKIKNSKAVRNLSDKSFKANKTRNIIAIIAIALTTLLFTSLFTMGIGAIESLQQATMRQSGGTAHALLKYINDEEFNQVKDHPLIKEIAYNRLLSGKVTNEQFLKRKTEFWYHDDVGLKLGLIELEKGHKPVAENEVIADSSTLQLLGIPLKEGATLSLKLEVHGKMVQREFILSGWWKSDPAAMIDRGQIYASKAYVDAHAEELRYTYKQDHDMTGAINAGIMFDNSSNIQGKLDQVITESGYSLDKNAPNFIETSMNWAYLSNTFSSDPETIFVLAGGLLLIMLTGYLIIYNIFQISVMRDIRFYGLLKTIGTSSSQLRRLIHRQALFLSLIGVPIGLLGGFGVGKSLIPLLLMNNYRHANAEVTLSPSPWIFIGSALFAVVTVMISIYKPIRVAATVSPIEAVRYVDGDTKKGEKKLKKSTNGAKMPLMARANLGRNKKRTTLVLLSLSLGLMLLNTTLTLSQSLDMDNFVSKNNDTDFLIAHADYFQEYFTGPDNATTESYIQAVQTQPGFEEGGRLYSGSNLFTVEHKENKEGMKLYGEIVTPDARGNLSTVVYGLEALPLHRLKLIDGELDYDKLASGKYILEGIILDNYDNPDMELSVYKVGEKVTLHNYMGTANAQGYTSHEFTVLGHVGVKSTNSGVAVPTYTNLYLPADIYKTLVKKPVVMSYAFNVSNSKEKTMESFLKNYTEIKEPTMHYKSKFTSIDTLSGMQKTILMIGGTLSIIIGVIGIINFANTLLTSILTRHQEFAILQSIGMTNKQLKTMLVYEGMYYVLGTSLCSILLGSLFSILIVRPLSAQIWFMSYRFIIWPLILVLLVLLVLGICLPLAIYSLSNKKTIVERLRTAE